MKSLGSITGPLLSLAGQDSERLAALVQSCYAGLVGPAAERLPAERFMRGILYLAVEERAWGKESEKHLEEVRRRLNALLGGEVVREISVRRCSRAKAAKAFCSKAEPIEAAEIPEGIKEAAKSIGDDRLRGAFLELAAKVSGLEKKRR